MVVGGVVGDVKMTVLLAVEATELPAMLEMHEHAEEIREGSA